MTGAKRCATGRLIVAIDGPSGAGKSTVTRMLANRLGYIHIDTGAMYRAVALAVKRAGIDAGDEQALAGICETLSVSFARNNGCFIERALNFADCISIDLWRFRPFLCQRGTEQVILFLQRGQPLLGFGQLAVKSPAIAVDLDGNLEAHSPRPGVEGWHACGVRRASESAGLRPP